MSKPNIKIAELHHKLKQLGVQKFEGDKVWINANRDDYKEYERDGKIIFWGLTLIFI